MICTTRICSRHATLALGGGGARGLAHLGAIQAVQEAGVAVDRIVGTSMGSLVGALAANSEPNVSVCDQAIGFLRSAEFASKQEALFGANPKPGMKSAGGLLGWYDRLRSYLWAQQLVHRVFRRRSILAGKVLEEVIADLIPDIDISETHIPLSVVTVDLLSGHQVVLERGSLRKAIAASAAIPGIFPPVEWDNMLLCDFGVIDSLPTRVARNYSHDILIAIDVGPERSSVENCESALHVLLRMDEIAERLVRRDSLPIADVLIRPDVGRFEWFDFSQPEPLIEAGLRAGRSALRNCTVEAAFPIPIRNNRQLNAG
jgi:NTE family protein